MSDGFSRRLPTVHLPPINFHHSTTSHTISSISTTVTTTTAIGIANNIPQLANNYHRSLIDALEALQNADSALRRAREAFNTSSMNIVDLTNPSSDASTADDLVGNVRHTNETSVRRPTSTQTNYDIFPRHIADSIQQQSRPRLPGVRDLLNSSVSPFQRGHEERNRVLDDHAVRRQAQARRDWERTQQRLQQRTESRSQNDSNSRSPQNTQSKSEEGHITDLTSDSEDSDGEATNPKETQEDLLAQQQKAAIDSQNRSAVNEIEGETTLSAYKCAICMDSPTAATTTVCGHMFCRQCILDSLKWSEQSRRAETGWTNRNINGRCPVCRKSLQSKDITAHGRTSRATGGIVLLEFKKMPRSQFNKKKEQEKFFTQEDNTVKGKEKAFATDTDAASDSGQSLGSIARKRKRPKVWEDDLEV